MLLFSIGGFNINKQTCVCHVLVGKKFDYSRETYRNGCSLAYIFTHLRSVKTHKNALVAFRILPTPSTKISSNLAGLNCFYGLVFECRFWWKNMWKHRNIRHQYRTSEKYADEIDRKTNINFILKLWKISNYRDQYLFSKYSRLRGSILMKTLLYT